MQVPLGILPRDENKSSEMVEILSHLHQYLPMLEFTENIDIPDTDVTVPVHKASVHPILLGGDQLTAVRARSAIKRQRG